MPDTKRVWTEDGIAKLESMVTDHHGADVVGGLAIRRNRIEQGAETLVDRLLAPAPATAVATPAAG